MKLFALFLVAFLHCALLPAHALTPEEEGIKNWFDVVTTGDKEAIYDAACEAAADAMRLADLFTDGMGTSMAGLAGMLNFDFSQLQFKLLYRSGNTAFVRVSGSVGQPQNLLGQGRDWIPFKGGDAAYENIAIAKYESGAWRHCDYLSPQVAREFLASNEYRQFQEQHGGR
jgi:hypothetical protein